MILETFVALEHAIVGNQCTDLFIGQGFEIGVGVVAGIRRVERG
jgi:hypothetical protein